MTTAKTTFLNEPTWRGKVFSGGWRTSVGGSQAVVEPATRSGLSEIGLATPLDLADAAEFDLETAAENILAVRPGMRIVTVSSKSGQGMEYLFKLLAQGRSSKRSASSDGQILLG